MSGAPELIGADYSSEPSESMRRPANGYDSTVRFEPAPTSFFDYLASILARWNIILICSFGMGLFVFLMTDFVPKTYRAEAVIRPEPGSKRASEFASQASVVLGGTPLLGYSGAFEAQEAVVEGEKYVSILQSHSFTAHLIQTHRLEPLLQRESGVTDEPLDAWQMWELMRGRLQCDVDLESGVVKLYFTAPGTDEAVGILGYYIDDLRLHMRNTEVKKAEVAAGSIEAEAQQASDAILQRQLYALVAEQKQRQRIAQAEADFAFTVIDSPIAKASAYRPKVKMDTAIATALTFVSCIILAALYDEFRRRWAVYEASQKCLAPVRTGSEPQAGVRINRKPEAS